MKEIILASTSPRRKELLKRCVEEFQIQAPKFNEEEIQCLDPRICAMASAYGKAYSIFSEEQEKIVIGSDTIVVYEDKILGKPKNREEAKEMLRLLSGRTHRVISGIAIFSKEDKVVDCVETLVTFYSLTEEEVEAYLDTGEYIDKAGAYGIQGYGEKLVKGYTGELENVIGLPIAYIKSYFQNIGV
ncbi:Maf family protein [Peptoniphilus sp. KCTC 25270]|uniref:Maf family protein n=1 Tax=Peptoniphilus sp. KCTC 25270 TaxID=2897414 RepID=UPI001E3E8F9C|nr:Maf family protein [Peptoniphilus sp. KCTC 25270]MCD1146908.1 Maf family protein [Peptoniphilus sp. KCTC 25270]